jgi:hypothetical protein
VLVNFEARPIFFLNFKETPSQEKHKTILSGLKINEMALSDQNDLLTFFRLHKMTYQNLINSGIQQSSIAFAPKALCLKN